MQQLLAILQQNPGNEAAMQELQSVMHQLQVYLGILKAAMG
jgi:hypothetical protein